MMDKKERSVSSWPKLEVRDLDFPVIPIILIFYTLTGKLGSFTSK